MLNKKILFLLAYLLLFIGQIVTGDILGWNVFIRAALFAVFLYIIYKKSGLNRTDIGLQNFSKKVLVWSSAVGIIIFTVLITVYFISPEAFLDQRYNQPLKDMLFTILVRLPLTTVLLEEVAFRGILLGFLLKSSSKKQALLISSAVFGLWHLGSSFNIQINSLPIVGVPPQLLVTAAIVCVTGLAGLVFSYLRLKTDSLLTPIVAHWSINAAGVILAWLAWSK